MLETISLVLSCIASALAIASTCQVNSLKKQIRQGSNSTAFSDIKMKNSGANSSQSVGNHAEH